MTPAESYELELLSLTTPDTRTFMIACGWST